MTNHCAETRLAQHARDRCQALLVRAADIVLPPEISHTFRLPKEVVRPAVCASASGDFMCHAPASAFCRLRVGLASDAPAVVRTISEYGLPREVTYRSAADLGRAVIAALDDEVRDVTADLRVREDGVLMITSQLHMRRQRALGFLHCAACGAFCHGERGLRDHQHVKHTGSYAAALDAVAAAKGTVVRYSAADAHLAELWAARAAESERQKKALPAGLAAARDGDEATLRELVVRGWSARDVTDRHGSSALHYAAGSGHLRICEYIVDSLGVPAGQAQSKDGRTALHWAARNGWVHICRWLLEKGLDPDVGTHDGTRPLHWAVWQGHLPVCDFLLAAKADLHAVNSYGCNAIQCRPAHPLNNDVGVQLAECMSIDSQPRQGQVKPMRATGCSSAAGYSIAVSTWAC